MDWQKEIVISIFLALMEELSVSHRRQYIYFRLTEDCNNIRSQYCRLNLTVPVLQAFFNGQDTRTDFRLSRKSLAVLMNLLSRERRHGWGATIETLVFLFWLASGTSYRVVARAFDMPHSTVHRIVHRVTRQVVDIRHQVIHFPTTAEDLEAVGQGFAVLARHHAFRKAAGAIDSCHVRIKPPGGPDGHGYKNRKLFASIILQAVCDHQGRFIDTYVGWPGSVNDARVVRHSPLYRSAYPPPGHFILADGGYPCLQRPLPLITPYKRMVQGVAAQRFNRHHSKARCIIECAFDMMKSRFRAIFLQMLEVHHTFAPHVITACAVLHNICLGAGDIMAPEDEDEDEDEGEDEDEDEGEADQEAVSGAVWRDQMAAEVSALEEAPVDHDYC
ncbi:putative nuclease HARBI1 [Austrofundulus limnaeus]|uniref:Nuclease HARBI1 n=1 Tax=Austrofundulus limnaeus TaxID=52670 RepID=A0A2I4BED3_AUSLI|nr:PREDICTED: putative nuclease HARBI1 [Austrofundulus limnaeus]XP_013866097.1 PREDICTED: putative nuclease HARBI1 [Austrofundulus limnaeus]